MSIITTQNFDSVTAPALPAGWTYSANLITFGQFAKSSPNLLAQNAADSSAAHSAIANTADTNGGNVTASAWIVPLTTNGAWYLLVRSSTTSIASASAYAVEVRGSTFSGGGGVAICKFTAGVLSTLSSRIGATDIDNTSNYFVSLTANGTALSLQIQRDSDNKWIQADGTWGTAQVNCLTASDSTYSGSDYYGLGMFTPSLNAGTSPNVGGGWDSFVLSTVTRAPGTFYVDADNGSDSGTGSLGSPWQTVAKVNAQTWVPGDQVFFKGGTVAAYTGVLIIAQSGSPGLPITFQNYGSGAANFQTGAADTSGAKLLNVEYVRLKGLNFSGPGLTVNLTATPPTLTTISNHPGIDVFSDGTVVPPNGSAWRSVYVDNCTVNGFWDGVLIHTPIKSNANYHGGTPISGTPTIYGYKDVRVNGCTVSNTVVNALVCWGSATSVSLNGTTPYYPTSNTAGNGSGSTFSGVYFGRNQIFNNFGDPNGTGIIAQPIAVWNTNGAIVEFNSIHDNGQTGAVNAGSGGAGGIGACVILESNNVIVRCNEAYNHHTNIAYDGCAYDTDGGATNCVIERNRSWNNDGCGLQNGVFTGSNANLGNVHRYNICCGDGKKNTAGIFQSFGGSATLHNNTLIATAATNGSAPVIKMGGTAAYFYNNIIMTTGAHTLISGVPTAAVNNLYYAATGTFSVVNGGTTYATLAAFQSAGYEVLNGAPVGMYANPLLTGPGVTGPLLPATPPGALSDFDPTPASPAIDAGISMLGVYQLQPGPVDFHGNPNYAGYGYDVGAVEYGAALLAASGGGTSAPTSLSTGIAAGGGPITLSTGTTNSTGSN